MKTQTVLQLTFSVIALTLLLAACSAKSAPPTARGYHSMVYDSESKRVILYGGMTGDYQVVSNFNYETWSFDPAKNQWKMMSPAEKPGGAGGGDMVYDSRADRAILVVGANPVTPNYFDNQITQTWAYDYNADAWTRLADAPFIGNIGHRMAYDSKSDKIILFGGLTVLEEYKYTLFNETWVYDYTSNAWTQMQPKLSPEPRNYGGMAYDPKADRTIICGGGDFEKAFKPLWGYDYNTNTWEEINYDNGPTERDYNGFVYAEKADRFILYGGFNDGTDETWIYDLNTNTWQQMQPAQNPGKISRFSMVYSPDVDKVILFGGQIGSTQFNYSAKTWIYDLKANTWTDVTPGN
jgi:N-acetylneuraminic acid mutarotase